MCGTPLAPVRSSLRKSHCTTWSRRGSHKTHNFSGLGSALEHHVGQPLSADPSTFSWFSLFHLWAHWWGSHIPAWNKDLGPKLLNSISQQRKLRLRVGTEEPDLPDLNFGTPTCFQGSLQMYLACLCGRSGIKVRESDWELTPACPSHFIHTCANGQTCVIYVSLP